jgi:predicted nucleotidyltransferase
MPGLGIIVPNMGIKPSHSGPAAGTASLAGALFTQTQQRVLGLIFGQPDRSFTISELIAATGAGSGAVQRELAKLVESGLVTMQPLGNQKRYQANPAAPIHDELVAIVRKTVALAEPLREALAPFADRIDAAFVYGSVARRSDHAGSDIDLMIVSDTLGYADVMRALHPLIERLCRDINPTLYSRQELRERLQSGNAFVTRVLEQPQLWLMGDKDVLGT